MIVLIVGVTLFFGIHLLPSLSIKVKLVERVGENPYKLIFSVVSLTGLGLIICGFKLSEFVPLWDPLPWGRSAAYWVMPIAIVLICAADVPNNIKRVVRHPMLIATGFSVSAQGVTSPFSFPEIARGKGESHLVPDGYAADVLLNSCHSVLMGRFLRASGNVTLYHYPKR